MTKDRKCIKDNYKSNWLNKEYASESETLSVAYTIYFCDYYHHNNYLGDKGHHGIVLSSRKEALDFIEERKKELNSDYPYLYISKSYLIPSGFHLFANEKEYFDNPNYDGKGWIHQTKDPNFKNYNGENK